jgi:serine/threonine protein kinase
VFRAVDPAGERLVAIKVFRLEISSEQSAALARELNQLIARDITHRAVAAPLAAGIEGDAAYLATEYVVGDSLDVSSRAAGPMPMADVVRIVERIAAAIDACAARGVHHGLLHPRSVILSGDGPRVTGFGIAEAISRIGMRLPARRPYAAPEGMSDVYSLAAIAYELISGRRMTPAGWDELSAEDGPELRDAFAAALSPDPQRRFATAGEFAAKLRSGAGPLSAPAPAIAAAPVAEPALADTADPGPEPEFDPDTLDRFADADAVHDLRLDHVSPAEPEVDTQAEAPVPVSWLGQQPRAFQEDVSEPERAGRGKMLILVLIALAVLGVAAYFASARKSAPSPAAQSARVKPADAKPPVAATTVDLPATAAPVPPETTLPAPTPSRPASGVTNAPPIRAASTGRVLIRTTPADAAVTINGEPRGKTPLVLRDLALGSYTIHVARNGYIAVDRRVRLTARRPSESMEISLRPLAPGRLMVESRPSGARVFVNDRPVGSTPLAMPGLPVGPATVRIEMDGYQPWITTAEVIAGEETRVAASLDRR